MVKEIYALLRENADEEQAAKMSAYMKDRFLFAGIPKPRLKELIRPYLAASAKQPLDWELVFALWEIDYREAQYIALEYLQKQNKKLLPSDIERLKRLIVTRSWWETVDSLDALVGELVKKDAALGETMLEWAADENLWLRRAAIDFQQRFKDDTDTELLGRIIEMNLGSSEFFINKAIGWSLREYAKVNAEWVSLFVEKHRDKMAPLSIREAEKHL